MRAPTDHKFEDYVPKKKPRYPYVHVDVAAAEADVAAGELWELGAEGLEERDATTLNKPEQATTLVAHFPDAARARAVAKLLGKRWPARVEYVVGDEWRDAWKAHFKPTRIGKRLVVRPSWEKYKKQPGDVVLVLNPGRAFGTGTHETTRLVLRELDERVTKGLRVLDVGCGSGILSIAAILLGGKSVIATDVDPDAVAVTKENAASNKVTPAIKASTRPLTKIPGQFDLVVANIEARVLVPMARALMSKVKLGGTLVLSGILTDQEDDIRAAYKKMSVERIPHDGEWIAVVLQKKKQVRKK